ncbi:MAG: prepilin peptidase [Oxalobacteraceae bacterium]|nr:MAG: prepilin peptidase [Oxalobacteraceae bacterium]
MTAAVLLTAMLLLAVRSDLGAHRIPNPLVAWGTLSALAASMAPDGIGLAPALAGFFLGLLALLPLYVLRALGAGDVKLMAAVGAFIGPQSLPLALLATFIAGGFMTVLVALHHGTARRLMRNVRDMLCSAWWRLACRETPALEPAPISAGKMPYALAIAVGAWCPLALHGSALASWLRPG